MIPELLAPAGDREKLLAALAFGGDAVYLSGSEFGMRQNAGNFDLDGLREAIRLCHERGVRVYVTVNTFPRNGEAERLPAYLEQLDDMRADAVLAADLGVAGAVLRYAPHAELHVSTQVSVSNYAAARAWHDLGARRVVLARELTLDEIGEIRAKTPADLQLECFVHGAMCMSYSGRCLLSSCLTGRDAGRGKCAQPCRWSYALCEEKRPGEYFPVEEAEGESYILNSRDLRMIEHLPELISAGVSSLKIEGRGKTAYYAACITGAYRRALDGIAREGSAWQCPPELAEETEKVSHRPYDTGFYFGAHDLQERRSAEYIRPWDMAALQLAPPEGCTASLLQKNHFAPGDTLEWLIPRLPSAPARLLSLTDADGIPVDAARHPHQHLTARFADPVPAGAILRKKVSE